MCLAAACGSDGGNPNSTGGSGGMGAAGGGTGGNPGTGGVGGGPLACDELPALGGELGGQCRGTAFECNGDLTCLGEQTIEVGPGIVDHPQGPDYTFEVVDFPGDYCTAALPPSPTFQCATENQLGSLYALAHSSRIHKNFSCTPG